MEKHDKSGPVPWSWKQSRVEEVLRWEGFVEKVWFWDLSERVKEWWMMRVVMMTEMSWQVNEVSRDITGEADEKNQGVDSRDGVMHLNERSVIFNEMVGGRERVTTDEERVLRRGWTEIRLLR